VDSGNDFARPLNCVGVKNSPYGNRNVGCWFPESGVGCWFPESEEDLGTVMGGVGGCSVWSPVASLTCVTLHRRQTVYFFWDVRGWGVGRMGGSLILTSVRLR